MCLENTQVEFEFGSGRIIFGRVMPLALKKIALIFSFCSCPLQIDILIEIRYIDVSREYAG